jgi:uncharacterized protein YjcR
MTAHGFPTPAPIGNRRALTHGSRSDAAIEPVRAELIVELRDQYPDIPLGEIYNQAHRLARTRLVHDWLDREGVMHTGPKRKGDGWGILSHLASWERTSDRWFAERRAEAQAKRTEHGAAMRDVLARLESGREVPQDATIADEDEGGDHGQHSEAGDRC